jgi:hypothetical protein
MKVEIACWIAAIILMGYYLGSLGSAYYQAMNALIDARQSQAYSILLDSK